MTDDTTDPLLERIFDLALTSSLTGEMHSAQAIPFLRSVTRELYSISPDGEIQANDRTPLDFNHQALPIERISEYLRAAHPYLFRQESTPSSNVQAPAPAPRPKSRSEMTLAEKADFIRVHGQDAFFDLPADPIAAIPLNEKRRSQMTMEEKASIIREKGSEFYLGLPE